MTSEAIAHKDSYMDDGADIKWDYVNKEPHLKVIHSHKESEPKSEQKQKNESDHWVAPHLHIVRDKAHGHNENEQASATGSLSDKDRSVLPRNELNQTSRPPKATSNFGTFGPTASSIDSDLSYNQISDYFPAIALQHQQIQSDLDAIKPAKNMTQPESVSTQANPHAEENTLMTRYARMATPPEGYVKFPGLPDPHKWMGALSRSIIEIFAGYRSSLQITRWLNPELYEYFLKRIELEQDSLINSKTQFRAQLIQIHATKAQQRSDDPLVDCSATVFDGRRIRLIVMQLRGSHDKWLIEELEIS